MVTAWERERKSWDEDLGVSEHQLCLNTEKTYVLIFFLAVAFFVCLFVLDFNFQQLTPM